MKTFLKRLYIFLGWLILVLALAPLIGILYVRYQYPSPIFLASEGVWNYVLGILASYVSITILFCFIFIKKTSNKYIVALILTMPMLLFDLWATDGPKLILDIINIAIFLVVGQLIALAINRRKIAKA